jgi:hypothetical protein
LRARGVPGAGLHARDEREHCERGKGGGAEACSEADAEKA